MQKLSTGVLLVALTATLAAQSAAIEDELMRHYQSVLRIDSTDPPGNESGVVAYVKEQLEKEGIATQTFQLEPNRPNLVARLKGSGTKRPLLIMAHTDTVNVDPKKWTFPPFSATRDGGYVYGRGTVDNKQDVAAGLIRIPADRPASDHVAARTGIAHKSPQFILFEGGRPRAHLDERAIQPERLGEVLAEHLPPSPGPRVVNPAVVSLDRYRGLLEDFVASRLPEDRFQWDYLDRLAKEASWRDDQAFALLTSVFDGTWDRDFKPARVIAHEFQGKIAGRVTPLRERAERLLKQITS